MITHAFYMQLRNCVILGGLVKQWRYCIIECALELYRPARRKLLVVYVETENLYNRCSR